MAARMDLVLGTSGLSLNMAAAGLGVRRIEMELTRGLQAGAERDAALARRLRAGD